jgi:hypothetical protein
VITPRHTLRLGACVIRLYGPEAPGESGPRGLPTLVTHFPDGAEVPAQPNIDPARLQMAHDLGYGDDMRALWLMTVHHEILHTWIAVIQGYADSATLWHVAHNVKPTPGLMGKEEALVLAFQKYLRSGVDGAALVPLVQWHLPTLAQAARVLLAPLGE